MTPGAQRSEVIGVADDRLRVRLAARAIEGRANDELIRFLARELGVRRDDITLVAGAKSRRKLLHLTGVTLPEARRRLGL